MTGKSDELAIAVAMEQEYYLDEQLQIAMAIFSGDRYVGYSIVSRTNLFSDDPILVVDSAVPNTAMDNAIQARMELDGLVGLAVGIAVGNELQLAVEIPRLDCPTREEFRKLCDQAESKEQLIELLQNQ